jgi:hypothetical protein
MSIYVPINQNHQLNWWFAQALKGHITGGVSRRTEYSVSRITCPATGKPVVPFPLSVLSFIL